MTQARNILYLQAVVVIYSVNTIIAKYVSAERFFSPRFFALLFLEVAVLGVYAIFWQQLIKRFELTVAYANKATGLIWSALFGVLLFSEQLTVRKVLGIALVAAGVFVINTKGRGGEKT